MQNNSRGICIVVVMSLLLSSCSNSQHLQQLKAYTIKLKQDAANTKIDNNLHGFDAPPAETYETKDLRSPFESAGNAGGEGGAASPTNFSHPLQGYPLSMLRFKGTATQGNDVWAFIQTPDNKLYQVKLGDSIGDHYGKITQISTTAVEVQEQIDTSATPGKTSTRIVTLRLKDTSQ